MDPSTQYHHQTHHPSPHLQPYDDQSTQAYYAFHQFNQHVQQQQQQQQQYPYHPQDYYANAHHRQTHQEPTSIHPPGVAPITPEPQTHVQFQQNNPYYAQAIVDQQPPQQQQQWQGNGGGFGPVAMNGGPRPLIGQTPYTGGGRRGGRPFRGGGPPFRGRGRGRGRGGPFTAPAGNPSAFEQGESSQAPVWPPLRMAWCELCRVDCTTAEILEQHKNGKRHKKNLQVYEELQKLTRFRVEGQNNEQIPVAEVKQEVPPIQKVDGSEDKQPQNDEDKVESEQKVEGRGRGLKRSKMRGGRGGKWMRAHDGTRRPIEPPKPKQVIIPFVCELCNVKCDSQVVFDSHLTGKKHLSNVKRFQGQQAILEQAALQALYPALQALYPALQALYPPNPNNASTSFGSPFHQEGFDGSQGNFPLLAPLAFPPGQASAPGVGSTSGSALAQPSDLENLDHQDPKPEDEPAASDETKSENKTSEIEQKESNIHTESLAVEPLDEKFTGADQVLSGIATDS